MQQRHNHKRGFNLIEAAIVLAVVGLVIGGIWVAASAVRDNYKANQLDETMQLLIRELRPYFDNSGPNWEQKQSIWPMMADKIPGLSFSNEALYSPHGEIDAYYSNWNGFGSSSVPYENYMEIRFYDIPRPICLRIMERIKSRMQRGINDTVLVTTYHVGALAAPGAHNCGGSSEPCFSEPLCDEDTNTIVTASFPAR